jgi:hypothetical protein
MEEVRMKTPKLAVLTLMTLGAIGCGPMTEGESEEGRDQPAAAQPEVSQMSTAGSFFCIFTGATVTGTGTNAVKSTAKSTAATNALTACQATITCPVVYYEDCCAGGQEFCLTSTSCPVFSRQTTCTANPASCTLNADGTHTCTSTAGCC